MCEHIICDNDMTTKISVITFQSDVVGIETVPNSNVIREEIKEQVPVFCDRQKNHPYNPYAIQVFIKKGQCIGYLLKDEFLAKAMDQGVAVIRSGYIDYVMNSRISVKMDVEFIQNSDVRELAIEQIRKNDKETICNDKENAEQVIVKWTRSALLPSVLKLVSAKKCTNKCSEEKNTQSDFSDITEIVKSQDNICDPTDQCMSEEQMVENTEENLDLQENVYKIYQEDNTEDSIEESVAKIISMQPAEKEFEDSFVCDSKEERALEEKNKTIQRSELSEEDLLYELSKLFPNGEIYEEEYTKKAKEFMFLVHKKAQKNGYDQSTQWLEANGFIVKKTGYIEPDMKYFDHNKPVPFFENAIDIANYVFKTYPLAGEYMPNEQERKMLYHSAVQTTKNVLMGNDVSIYEDAVLVLETIQLLKDWHRNAEMEKEQENLWAYIYFQYGFNPENSINATQKLYQHFRKAIKNTFVFYKRFFAPEGTQRYYTTLLLHAIAPRYSILAFYNVLFDFYAKNLNYQYVAEDTSYKIFAQHMKAVFDSKSTVSKEIKFRTEIFASGLKTLFLMRSGFMAALSESIVRKMNSMIRGDFSILETDRNYWDVLLLAWYKQKNSTERATLKGEHRKHSSESIATTAERIAVQYVMKNSSVGLEIPRIRLNGTSAEQPRLEVYQNEICIYEKEMSVTGNSLCLTTVPLFVPLSDMDFDFKSNLEIQVKIEYNSSMLYQSAQKLVRPYILFDEHGIDRKPKNGTAYLFAGENSIINFSNDTGVYQYPHRGQFYRINLGEISSVCVDGMEIFAGSALTTRIRHHASVKCLPHLRAVQQGKDVELYESPFDLTICLPSGEPAVRYQISLDGVRYTMSELDECDGAVKILSASDEEMVHSVRVIDMNTSMIKYEYLYAIFPDCEVKMERQLYFDNGEIIRGKFRYGNVSEDLVLAIPEQGNSVTFNLRDIDLTLEIDIPLVRCAIGDQNAFLLQEKLWYECFDTGELVKISVPEGWTDSLMLGTKQVLSGKEGVFELGNELRSQLSSEKISSLWLFLKSSTGSIERYELTQIIREPCFMESPLYWKENQICWHASDNFYGSDKSEFQVKYILPDGNEVVCKAGIEDIIFQTLPEDMMGICRYSITLEKRSLFASAPGKVIDEGTFTIGNPNEFRFANRMILTKDAQCWNFDTEALKTVHMMPGSGIVKNLKYQGMDTASGETVEAPHYTGTLYYQSAYGGYREFNANPDAKDFELINPVHIWIVNDYLLILRCTTEDAVYVDTRYNTIVNRSPKITMSKSEQRMRLETPDYFNYKVEEV